MKITIEPNGHSGRVVVSDGALTQAQLIEVLEPLVDANSLSDVILALARVCNEKAEHVLINWQDKPLAKLWDRNAARLDKISDTGLPEGPAPKADPLDDFNYVGSRHHY